MFVINSCEEIVHANIGSPGSFHDARVYRRSELETLVHNLPPQYHLLGKQAFSTVIIQNMWTIVFKFIIIEYLVTVSSTTTIWSM